MDTNPSFAPVEHRHRHDGWTVDVQRIFIEHLAMTGSVQRAAQLVGRSASSAYRLRARPEAAPFRAAWSAATALAYNRLHDIAMDRIVNGLEVPVFDAEGAHVDSRVVHNDKLLMFMLTHLKPDRHVDFTRAEATTRILPQQIEADPSNNLAAALEVLELAAEAGSAATDLVPVDEASATATESPIVWT